MDELEGQTTIFEVLPSMGWRDPLYVAAKRARAEAYATFCTVAGANPHRMGTAEYSEYFTREVIPVREIYVQANDAWAEQTRRVAAELEAGK